MGGYISGDGTYRKTGSGGGRSMYGNSAGPGGGQYQDPRLKNRGGGGGQGAPSLNINAKTNPGLDALSGQYKDYLNQFRGNDSHTLDMVGQKIRDAREGGAAALSASEGLRGIASSNRRADYEAGTQRQLAGGLADAAVSREAMYGDALRGGVGVHGASAELALREKGMNLSAAQGARMAQQQQYQQQRDAANDEFQKFLQALQFGGGGGMSGGGGGYFTGYY